MECVSTVTLRRKWKAHFFKLQFMDLFGVFEALLKLEELDHDGVRQILCKYSESDMECLQWCVLSSGKDIPSKNMVADRQYTQIYTYKPDILYLTRHKYQTCQQQAVCHPAQLKKMLQRHKYNSKDLQNVLESAVTYQCIPSIEQLLPKVTITRQIQCACLDHESPNVQQQLLTRKVDRIEVNVFMEEVISRGLESLVVSMCLYVGWTPQMEHIRVAGEKNETKIGFFLVSEYLKVHSTQPRADGSYWFLQCCKVGHLALAKELLQQNIVDVFVKDMETGKNILSFLLEGDLEEFIPLLGDVQLRELVCMKDRQGRTAQFYPGRNTKQFVKQLECTDVTDIRDKKGFSLALVQLLHDKQDMQRIQLEKGVRMHSVDNAGHSLFTYACIANRYKDYVPMLQPYVTGEPHGLVNTLLLEQERMTFVLLEANIGDSSFRTRESITPSLFKDIIHKCISTADIETVLLRMLNVLNPTCTQICKHQWLVQYICEQKISIHNPAVLSKETLYPELLEQLLACKLQNMQGKKKGKKRKHSHVPFE